MDEKDLNRELDEMLVMLKTLEKKLISEPNVTIRDVIDIYAIHLAALRGYYDISEALEFITRFNTGMTMQNKSDYPMITLNHLSDR